MNSSPPTRHAARGQEVGLREGLWGRFLARQGCQEHSARFVSWPWHGLPNKLLICAVSPACGSSQACGAGAGSTAGPCCDGSHPAARTLGPSDMMGSGVSKEGRGPCGAQDRPNRTLSASPPLEKSTPGVKQPLACSGGGGMPDRGTSCGQESGLPVMSCVLSLPSHGVELARQPPSQDRDEVTRGRT